jgi:hypothetical protein
MNDRYIGIPFSQWRQIRIVFPQFRTGSSNIGHEAAGIVQMQIPDGRRQHDDVTGRKKVLQEKFAPLVPH